MYEKGVEQDILDIISAIEHAVTGTHMHGYTCGPVAPSYLTLIGAKAEPL